MTGPALAAARRIGAVGLLAPLFVLGSGAPAGAAMCARLSTSPVRPVAGQPARVELRTLTQVTGGEAGFRLEPRAVPSTYPFHVTATRSGELVLIHVERSTDPNLWTGEFVLDKPGLWDLLVENLEPRQGSDERMDPRCYSRLPLVVHAESGRPPSVVTVHNSLRLTLVLAIAFLTLLVGTTLLVVVRGLTVGGRPPPPR